MSDIYFSHKSDTEEIPSVPSDNNFTSKKSKNSSLKKIVKTLFSLIIVLAIVFTGFTAYIFSLMQKTDYTGCCYAADKNQNHALSSLYVHLIFPSSSLACGHLLLQHQKQTFLCFLVQRHCMSVSVENRRLHAAHVPVSFVKTANHRPVLPCAVVRSRRPRL